MPVRAARPHDCPDTCGMPVTVQDGVAVKLQGDSSMPFTQGTLCTRRPRMRGIEWEALKERT